MNVKERKKKERKKEKKERKKNVNYLFNSRNIHTLLNPDDA